MEDNRERPVPAAPAAGPALPSLKKDNCIRNGRHRSVFVAEENIRLYIAFAGEQNVGALTVTTADCLEVSDFQAKWHSFRTNVLTKLFPTGMWSRERQPRSGNWHAHAVVDVGWDFKTGFPFEEVGKKVYRNVRSEVRNLWKLLREKAESHGFGRTELLPLKHSGPACARYFTKYLAKSFGSEKCVGEEKARLFSVWGRKRYVYRNFSFRSSRIAEKRKEWLAEALELSDKRELKGMLGPHWWFHYGHALLEVIMPAEFYQIEDSERGNWDDLGLSAYAADLAAWPEDGVANLMLRSQYNLFYEIGVGLFGRHSGQAREFALNRIAKAAAQAPKRLCPQLQLDLQARIAGKIDGSS